MPATSRTHAPGSAQGSKPPVTQQEDWDSTLLPWLRSMLGALGLENAAVDVDRIHETTGVVAREVQRSMAPIASYLVGVAVGRGTDPAEACRILEDATMRRDADR